VDSSPPIDGNWKQALCITLMFVYALCSAQVLLTIVCPCFLSCLVSEDCWHVVEQLGWFVSARDV
jgi:hypothetical protein